MKFKFLFSILVLFCATTLAQNLNGFVYELDQQNNKVPLVSANLFWKNSTVGTVTDLKGHFSLKKPAGKSAFLVVSYTGYVADTIEVSSSKDSIDIVLSLNTQLKEVLISAERSSKFMDDLNPENVEIITGKELLKAACCNLGESFTTNASVDVQYQDAVSGARQIQLLGLAGGYTQMLFENIPAMNGVGNSFGLGFVPGPWISQISVSKGSASVVNGYESITGQINVGYKSPTDAERYYFNAFQSSHYKTDLNANASIELNDHVSTIFLAHSNFVSKMVDDNFDSFTDDPKSAQYNFMNRWKIHTDIGLESEFGVHYLTEKRTGGQLHPVSSGKQYKIDIDSKHFDFYSKTGYVFPVENYTSIALMLDVHSHDQNTLFGERKYDANQKIFFSKLIFETRWQDETHKLITGLSYNFDELKENVNSLNSFKKESVPGLFLEYNYSPNNLISIVPGVRVDFHNLFGTLVTPRIHMKYNLDENTSIRASAGKGYRTVNLFANNMSLLASSRNFVLNNTNLYEEAYNYGLNLTRYFMFDGRELRLTLDYYRTDFIKQVVTDIDTDPSSVLFYDLNGSSFSNSYQVELAYEVLPRLDISAAYRYTDVRTTYNGNLNILPLQSRYKVLTTVSYRTPDRDWVFDASFLVNGPGRIPSTSTNPAQYQRPENFDAFVNINAQISKKFDIFELYVGAENLTDFKQANPVIASDDPFGKYFDASMVWGPVSGRKFYAGIRLSVF
ncbi:TonB-dependent receptor [Ignavibacteriales bacterium]